MKTLIIGKNDIAADGHYIKRSVSFDGHIEIDSELGTIIFQSLKATGHIEIGRHTNIRAYKGIIAGTYILAGGDLIADEDIRAVDIWVIGNLEAGQDVGAGWILQVRGSAKAGTIIRAKDEIRVGKKIEALEIYCRRLIGEPEISGRLIQSI